MEAVSVLAGGTDLSETLSRGEAAEMLSAMLDVLESRDTSRWFW